MTTVLIILQQIDMVGFLNKDKDIVMNLVNLLFLNLLIERIYTKLITSLIYKDTLMKTNYDLSTMLNIIGLCIDICGAFLMFFNSPKMSYQVCIYTNKEMEVLERKAKRMHRLTQIGAILLGIGFILQIGGNLFK